MGFASKDLIGRAMAAGVLTVLLSVVAVPLVLGGLSFALWGGLGSAVAGAVFLVVGAAPATLSFAVMAALFTQLGLKAYAASMLAFMLVTTMALILLHAAAEANALKFPFAVWLTPLFLAILTATWAFHPVRQRDDGEPS